MSILIVKNTFQRSDNDTVRPDIRLNDHIGDGGDKVFAGVIGDMPHVVAPVTLTSVRVPHFFDGSSAS